MKIKIMNLRFSKPCYEFDVRVDRFNKILGNKFYMRTENERDTVCNAYEKWIRDNLNNPTVKKELDRLFNILIKNGRIRLWCWCAPKRCHAESIKRILEEYLNNYNLKEV